MASNSGGSSTNLVGFPTKLGSKLSGLSVEGRERVCVCEKGERRMMCQVDLFPTYQ
jgi:hypothetical protein